MSERRFITLLTDYGQQGGFVGALHAVAGMLAPDACVIDLDHRIPPQDVRLGALRLERLVRYLPTGVHVAVVDPGVGGRRRPVGLRAGAHHFVGPDNGLLAWAVEAAGGAELAVELDVERCSLSPRARTFDGRDLFVPVAAQLSNGATLSSLGSPIDPRELVTLERPRAQQGAEGAWQLEVLQVDSFGNVQLSADRAIVEAMGLRPGDRLQLGGGEHVTVGETFGDVEPGEAVVLLDSDGQLALSMNRGRADRRFRLEPGDPVMVRRVGS